MNNDLVDTSSRVKTILCCYIMHKLNVQVTKSMHQDRCLNTVNKYYLIKKQLHNSCINVDSIGFTVPFFRPEAAHFWLQASIVGKLLLFPLQPP